MPHTQDFRRPGRARPDGSPLGRLDAVIAAAYTLEDRQFAGHYGLEGVRMGHLRDLSILLHLGPDTSRDRRGAVMQTLADTVDHLRHYADDHVMVAPDVPGHPELEPQLTVGDLRVILAGLQAVASW